MRVVVYDAEDMEPITVIKLEAWAVNHLKRNRSIVVPVMSRTVIDSLDWDRPARTNHCRLRFEPIHKDREILMWLCTTMDGESALLLRSVFLPGQQGAVCRERERAFLQGVTAALAHF